MKYQFWTGKKQIVVEISQALHKAIEWCNEHDTPNHIELAEAIDQGIIDLDKKDAEIAELKSLLAAKEAELAEAVARTWEEAAQRVAHMKCTDGCDLDTEFWAKAAEARRGVMSFDEQPYSKEDHDLHDACEEIARLKALFATKEAELDKERHNFLRILEAREKAESSLAECRRELEAAKKEDGPLHDHCFELRSLLADEREKNASLSALLAKKETGTGLLRELIADGPYQNDDGECSFCFFAPNDSEDLDNTIAHKENCLWRRSREYLLAAPANVGKENI